MAEPKKCPHCGTEMERMPPSIMQLWKRLNSRLRALKREKSEITTSIADDLWVCPKCHHRSNNAEVEKDSK